MTEQNNLLTFERTVQMGISGHKHRNQSTSFCDLVYGSLELGNIKIPFWHLSSSGIWDDRYNVDSVAALTSHEK